MWVLKRNTVADKAIKVHKPTFLKKVKNSTAGILFLVNFKEKQQPKYDVTLKDVCRTSHSIFMSSSISGEQES